MTEFFPISSSAHLILVPWLFRFTDPGLAFDVALHFGTLVAVVAYFFRDWVDIIRTGFGGEGDAPRRLLWMLVIGAVPGALAGALLEASAESAFRSPALIAVTLCLGGALLFVADRVRGERKAVFLSELDALLVGLAQAAAIVPGVSRSGATIAAARALGFGRTEAARISFLFAAPITAGAVLYALRHLTAADLTLPFFAGIVTAAVTGLLAIHWLLRYVARGSYRPFVWYRLALAALVVAASFLR